MSRSFLAAIRGAVSTAPEIVSSEEDQPGADAPQSPAPSGANMETVMSGDPKPGATASGISQADHDAAVASARSEGEAAGAKAANDRVTAIVSADGIKGDGARMTAALDLAAKSPGMSAEDVAGFVTANVSAKAPATAPVASLASRVKATKDDEGDALGASDQPAAKAGRLTALAQKMNGAKRDAR